MSNRYWQSELWGSSPDDLCEERELVHGFVCKVRVRRQQGNELMLIQLIHPSGSRHSEHVYDVSESSDVEALREGFSVGEWLASGAKPR